MNLTKLFLFFFLSLSLSLDTSRDGHDIETATDIESSAQCAAMCNEDNRCMAWSYEKNNCSLKDAMPLHTYKPDVTSGEPGKLFIYFGMAPVDVLALIFFPGGGGVYNFISGAII